VGQPQVLRGPKQGVALTIVLASVNLGEQPTYLCLVICGIRPDPNKKGGQNARPTNLTPGT